MSRMFYGSIDVSKIDKTKLYVGKKGTYCNVTIWVNDEPDTYGNNASVQEGQTKEEREAGTAKNYLGNLKEHVSGEAQTAPATSTSNDDGNPLPF